MPSYSTGAFVRAIEFNLYSEFRIFSYFFVYMDIIVVVYFIVSAEKQEVYSYYAAHLSPVSAVFFLQQLMEFNETFFQVLHFLMPLAPTILLSI